MQKYNFCAEKATGLVVLKSSEKNQLIKLLLTVRFISRNAQ